MFVDYSEFLPFTCLSMFHLSSFTLAVLSNEFWHVRLLTASHLFVLDSIVYFRFGLTVGNSSFSLMPIDVYKKYRNKWIIFFEFISFVGCLSCLTTFLCTNQDKFYCTSYDPFSILEIPSL